MIEYSDAIICMWLAVGSAVFWVANTSSYLKQSILGFVSAVGNTRANIAVGQEIWLGLILIYAYSKTCF